ncbi:MAG: FadR/GntR family transcriptional regulator [Acidobacteria bacterium]|nr:FadR/GntR family transcriptional regulator [Acidobacteriota bacterium]
MTTKTTSAQHMHPMAIASTDRTEWGPQIRRTAITDEVISRIKDLILQRVLIPGCKLPSERELVKVLGVSRPTLRQAMKALQVLGIIRSRQGDGSYLEETISESLKVSLDFAIAVKGRVKPDLFETRQTMEVKLAALAAERRTEQDLENMRIALAGMRASAGVPDRWCEHDVEFHTRIVEAAKNTVMASIVEMLAHLLVQSRNETVRLLTDYEGSLRSHERIFEEIERQDSACAAKALAEHFRLMEDRARLRGLARGSENLPDDASIGDPMELCR